MRRILIVVATITVVGVVSVPASGAQAGPTLYVINADSDTIAIFTITGTGELQHVVVQYQVRPHVSQSSETLGIFEQASV